MRKYQHIAVTLALTLATGAFAGGIGGGGTPPAMQDTVMSINRMINFRSFTSDVQIEREKQQQPEQKKPEETKDQQQQKQQSEKRD